MRLAFYGDCWEKVTAEDIEKWDVHPDPPSKNGQNQSDSGILLNFIFPPSNADNEIENREGIFWFHVASFYVIFLLLKEDSKFCFLINRPKVPANKKIFDEEWTWEYASERIVILADDNGNLWRSED